MNKEMMSSEEYKIYKDTVERICKLTGFNLTDKQIIVYMANERERLLDSIDTLLEENASLKTVAVACDCDEECCCDCDEDCEYEEIECEFIDELADDETVITIRSKQKISDFSVYFGDDEI